MKAPLLAALLAVSLPAWSGCEDLQLEQTWVRSGPPGATMLAGYGVLRNGGAQALRLQQARSLDFGAVEFHQSELREGMSRMVRLPQLLIPPRSSLSLAPGGLHFMLFRPERALAPGDSVRMRLYCSPQDWLYVEMPVKAP